MATDNRIQNEGVIGYTPSPLTPTKTLLELVQDLYDEIEKLKPEAQDTRVFIKNLFKERVDFKEDPQTQLDNHAKSIAGNIEGIARTNERIDDKTEIVKLWTGRSTNVLINNALNYDLFIVVFDAFSSILSINLKPDGLDYSSTGINTRDNSLDYLFSALLRYNSENNNIETVRAGFNYKSVWNDRTNNSLYKIIAIYGIKGVQQ